jgi:hypothetical protein
MHDVARQPLALTAAAIFLVCANPALANPGFSEKFFSHLDLNGNGIVQRAEADRWFMQLFRNVDTDGDDRISFEESQSNFNLSLEQPVRRENDRGGEAFDLIDRNKDGAISPEEFLASCGKFFALLDKDRDGQITLAEVRSSGRGSLASR